MNTRKTGMSSYGLPNIVSGMVKNRHSISIRDFRVKVLGHEKEYGIQAAINAFSVGRSTILGWKKTLKHNLDDINSLIPKSTRPHHIRQPKPDYRINEEIVRLRNEHPRLGKAKLKPMLDEYCRKHNLLGKRQKMEFVSESTIGRRINSLKKRGVILSDEKLRLIVKSESGSYNQVLTNEDKKKHKKQKLRRGKYQPKLPGDLVQVDCVEKVRDGIKRYVISAIDYKSSFAFSLAYKTLNSTNAKDFFLKFQQVAPFSVAHVQTDNGQEFHKFFMEELDYQKLVHFWNYPRKPKYNGKIERYNRTKQDEIIDRHLADLFDDINLFNQKLMDYLISYNTERPHYNHTIPTIGIKGKLLKTGQQIPPMRALINMLQLDQRKSEMLWTYTDTLT